MKNKLLFSILGVLAISAVVFSGTYAYYMASEEDEFSGDIASGLTSTLVSDEVYRATNLVPLNDSLVSTAISKSSNKCIDKNGYQVCSLYKLTLSNSSASENLYGYVRTSASTYTTDNLKYQVFDSSYNAVTDVMTISMEMETPVYFQKNSSNYSVTSSGNTVYYLAIWLHDTGDFQDDDYSKTFNGYVGFEAVEYIGSGTGRIEASLDVMISFTIDGTTYSAEEGMTWAEWCDSDYNTIGLRLLGGETNYVSTADDYYLQYNGSIIEGANEIVSDRQYIKYVEYGYVPYYFTLQLGRISQSAENNYITSTILNRASYVGTGVKLIPGAQYKLVGVSGMRYGVQTITTAGLSEIQAGQYLTTTNKLDSGWQTSGYTFTANSNAAICWLTASKSDNSDISPNDAMPVYIQRIS